MTKIEMYQKPKILNDVQLKSTNSHQYQQFETSENKLVYQILFPFLLTIFHITDYLSQLTKKKVIKPNR